MPHAVLTRRLVLLAGGAAAAGLLMSRPAVVRTLEFNSPYNFIAIDKQGSLVTFRYAFKPMRLSTVDLSRPPYQVVPYSRYYYAADLIKPRPTRVLMAGLGAGGFNRLFNLIYPESRLVTVEIDPMILSLAQEHADFRPGPNNEVVIDDARIFLRNSDKTYDWILLDAFDRDAQIPIHLTTREFFRILSDRLADDGVMLTNLHQGTNFFASHVLTIRAVFPDVVLMPVKGTNNVMVMAAKSAASSMRTMLEGRQHETDPRYSTYGVDLSEIVRRIVDERTYLPEVEKHGIVLTDDYAPVESLDGRSMPLIEPRGS